MHSRMQVSETADAEEVKKMRHYEYGKMTKTLGDFEMTIHVRTALLLCVKAKFQLQLPCTGAPDHYIRRV